MGCWRKMSWRTKMINGEDAITYYSHSFLPILAILFSTLLLLTIAYETIPFPFFPLSYDHCQMHPILLAHKKCSFLDTLYHLGILFRVSEHSNPLSIAHIGILDRILPSISRQKYIQVGKDLNIQQTSSM